MRRIPKPHGPATLRLSVTDRCNLRCRYCMPAAGVTLRPRGELPSLEELAGAAAWLAANAGVTRIKLTGGEPLVRAGVVDLVRDLAAIPGVQEVSLTTNGTRLAQLAIPLRTAGLARVNVSLDSPDAQRFAHVTRGGDVSTVLAGIAAAQSAGLAPVKLNAVLRRTTWRADVPALLDFAVQSGLELRFIELMRTGPGASFARDEFVPVDEVQAWLAARGPLRPLPVSHPAPARATLVTWGGRAVVVGWIAPVSHRFCGGCDRLRLDALGRLRRCLMDDAYVPLVALLRTGDSPTYVVESFLADKRPPGRMASTTPMHAIGG